MRVGLFPVLFVMIGLALSGGCRKEIPQQEAEQEDMPCVVETAGTETEEELLPCPTVDAEAQKEAAAKSDPYDIPRFGANSPFSNDYDSPVPKKEKMLWARSCLWEDAPELLVEKWLSEEPATEGKYVLIEFWATWCGPCRKSITLLNGIHEKFGDEIVVIGVSDETEEDVRKLENPMIEYYSAIDTQARAKKSIAVFGIPHVIIVEPGGCVVWEGFPLLKDYELTEELVDKILNVGREQKTTASLE